MRSCGVFPKGLFGRSDFGFGRCFSSHRALTHFTDEQCFLRDTVRKFALEQLRPHVEEQDRSGCFNPSVVPAIFEQGFMGMEISSAYQGANMTFFDSLIVIEEIARIDPAVAVMIDIHNVLINRVIDIFGSDEQKKAYLPKLATDTVGSFCLSEAGSGSDAFALKTRARRVENGFRLSGAQKGLVNDKYLKKYQ
eukprot:TRINITY_DN105491_c0_g1_i1.p1 TRINITY_DN105491_c0_g1~~TRINITY_DN105491_c0_g1_i1.p1  ORF type:complete len:194 (-),score=16.02 TRINITY_DN105491_c0_g1_i1:816-1397(-)